MSDDSDEQRGTATFEFIEGIPGLIGNDTKHKFKQCQVTGIDPKKMNRFDCRGYECPKSMWGKTAFETKKEFYTALLEKEPEAKEIWDEIGPKKLWQNYTAAKQRYNDDCARLGRGNWPKKNLKEYWVCDNPKFILTVK